MRIVEIRERDAAMGSAIRNAYIDFSTMTCSTVAVVTDQTRNGKPVIGYGFTSNGRYGAGALMRDRFIPRLMNASADSLLDDDALISPQKCSAAMMTNEKPGGHGERSTAVGAIDMAIWDAVAKTADVPLYQLLADRYRGGEVDRAIWVYAAGGYYYPGKGLEVLKDEMRGYLDMGYSTVKMKIGGAPLAEDLARIEAVLELVPASNLCVDANGRFDLKTALA